MLLLLACVHALDPALLVEPAAAVSQASEPTDPAAHLAWMIGEDPLARRPRLPSAPADEATAAWLAVARAGEAKATDWNDLETTHRGTVAVPLARGARLAGLETALSDPNAAFAWVLPLPAEPPTQEQVRPPLAWLGGGGAEALLSIAERQVLLGWLDGPNIALDAAARGLEAPVYDRASNTPAGRLVLARAAGARDETRAEAGRTALLDATWLALTAAAADRDAEQAAWRTLRAEEATRLGLTGDPTKALLTQATEALTADAASDASAGLALLAQAALRWEGGCPDAPCGGFDRVAAMQTAARWDPEVAPLAAAWTAIASKDALDRLESAWNEPSFPTALDAQVEVLLATGGSVDRSILRYPRPGPAVQLALSRAAGGGDLTGKEDLLHTLRSRLGRLAAAALESAPERIREPLTRIARRAQ